MNAGIFIASLNEEYYIESCIRSLQEQQTQYPIVLIDSASTDDTVKIAERLGVEVFQAPRGKLSAMDHAIRSLDYDVILLCDADRLYPRDWTEEITAPLVAPNVVMVSGTLDSRALVDGRPFLQSLFDIHSWLSPAVEGVLMAMNHYYSGNTSFYKCAYIESGGYDIRVNQKDFYATFLEEEFDFPHRMSRVGNVVVAPYAKAYTSSRRFNPLEADAGFSNKQAARLSF